MKVKDAIRKLQKFKADAELILIKNEGDFYFMLDKTTGETGPRKTILTKKECDIEFTDEGKDVGIIINET